MRPAPARLGRSFVRSFVVRSFVARAASSRKPSSRYPSSHNRGRVFSPRKREIRRKRIFARGAWPRGLKRGLALAPAPALAPNLRTARPEELQALRETFAARRERPGVRPGGRGAPPTPGE